MSVRRARKSATATEKFARALDHRSEGRADSRVPTTSKPILATTSGSVTTGLLSAVSYLKDNRLVPRGFEKTTAPPDVAVQGDARTDTDFIAGEDRVRYRIEVSMAPGPLTIEAELWYQSIAYRWAQNLRVYDAPEPRRFVAYYDQMAPASALRLASATAQAHPTPGGR